MEDEHDLEEGEIEDDEEVAEPYTPLERPQTYAMDAPHKRFQEVDNSRYSESEEDIQSSDSDSDSDLGPQRKKTKKIKVTPKPLQKRPQEKLKKYDIWSTRAQEDVLAETMTSCDVTIKDRSRSVESYDFSIARKYYAELEKRQGNKRRRDDMSDVNFKPRKRSPSEEKKFSGKPRDIPELDVNELSSVEDIVKDIATKLNEQRDDLILKVVEAMGKEKAIEIYKETKKIESEGGMPILNLTRRRTPGGVYLYLVRNDYHITPEQKQMIFTEEKQKYNKISKERKRKKMQELKKSTNAERNKILPELLTRPELFAKSNSIKKLNDSDEANCTNPPPSPETDHLESGDNMEPSPPMESPQLLPKEPVSDTNNSSFGSRGKIKIYDDDFLDISCENDMDLF